VGRESRNPQSACADFTQSQVCDIGIDLVGPFVVSAHDLDSAEAAAGAVVLSANSNSNSRFCCEARRCHGGDVCSFEFALIDDVVPRK
jgi:hypothetical protein